MKMAKASEQDIEAAGKLMTLLNDLSSGYHPATDQDEDDERQVYFDPDDRQHLRALYDALEKILDSAPGMPVRVIGGMCYVIMWDKNRIIDPDADTLEMHPIHVQNAKDAARWRYIRGKLAFTGNGNGTCSMHALNLPANIEGWPEVGEIESFCDAAIDSAMEK